MVSDSCFFWKKQVSHVFQKSDHSQVLVKALMENCWAASQIRLDVSSRCEVSTSNWEISDSGFGIFYIPKV